MLSEPLDLTIMYEPNTKMNYVPDYPGIPTTQAINKFITINCMWFQRPECVGVFQ